MAKKPKKVKPPKIGLNGLGPADQVVLTRIVVEIEKLQDEIKPLREDIAAAMKHAAECGFDVATVREVLKLRAMEPDKRGERETLRDVYQHALGMLSDTPLGRAARAAAAIADGTVSVTLPSQDDGANA